MSNHDLSDGRPILQTLGEHHDGKVGFVIFRTYYGDNDEWTRFVKHLTSSTLHAINLDAGVEGMMRGRNKLLKDAFFYHFRDDKSTLDGASADEVRGIFRQWAHSVGGGSTMPRYRLCIMVDKEALESVMGSVKPWNDDRSCEYVKLINDDHLERTPRCSDAEYVAIDGCTAYDVGWMRQSARDLVPSAYRVLMNWNWEDYYCRPLKAREG